MMAHRQGRALAIGPAAEALRSRSVRAAGRFIRDQARAACRFLLLFRARRG
jgi:hypothetical protein